MSWDDCFCEIEFDLLARLARRHFVDGVPTVELLRQSADEAEQRAVTAVSMLDLPDEELLSQCRIGEDDCGHMLECAASMRRQLAAQGIHTPADAAKPQSNKLSCRACEESPSSDSRRRLESSGPEA